MFQTCLRIVVDRLSADAASEVIRIIEETLERMLPGKLRVGGSRIFYSDDALVEVVPLVAGLGAMGVPEASIAVRVTSSSSRVLGTLLESLASSLDAYKVALDPSC